MNLVFCITRCNSLWQSIAHCGRGSVYNENTVEGLLFLRRRVSGM